MPRHVRVGTHRLRSLERAYVRVAEANRDVQDLRDEVAALLHPLLKVVLRRAPRLEVVAQQALNVARLAQLVLDALQLLAQPARISVCDLKLAAHLLQLACLVLPHRLQLRELPVEHRAVAVRLCDVVADDAIMLRHPRAQ